MTEIERMRRKLSRLLTAKRCRSNGNRHPNDPPDCWYIADPDDHATAREAMRVLEGL